MASKHRQSQKNHHVLTNSDVFFKQKPEPVNNKKLTKKELLYKLFHPDYILFDWEYFSRELEFE